MKTFTHESDNQLVKAFKEGSIDALEVLVNRYKDRIFTGITVLVKDKLLAEDLFQEVFFQIIDSIRDNSYNEECEFLQWSLGKVHTLCVDHFKKVTPLPTITTGDDVDIFEVINIAEDGNGKVQAKKQPDAGMDQLIDLLSVEQREVIVLRHYANFSFRDIAKMIDCSFNATLVRMKFGFLNLRRMMLEKQIAL